MSWKSFVTAGLLCVLASPAFAAPTVQITPGGTFANGHLDANGDWVWLVRLSQSNPPVDLPDPDGGGPLADPAPGSPLAAELGFSENSSELLSATANTAEFDTPNPGNVIFGWETLTNLGGSGACDSATPGNCPVGLQSSLTNDQIFAALGSEDYLSDVDGKDFLTIVIQGPSTAGSLETDLVMSGSYGGGGNQGRIAELNQAWDPSDNNPPMSVNYDTYSGTFSRQALGGDTDLNGSVNFDDFQNLLGAYNGPGKWFDGNFNGDAAVDFNDFQDLLGNYNTTYNVNSGAGGGGAAGVPEPATAVLMLFAAAFLAGWRARS